MTNTPAPIGHNGPPDPLDEALAPYADYIAEAETWLDGQAVTDEAQMKAVDALLKEIKAAKKATDTAKKAEAQPLHAAWKAALARYDPTINDLDKMAKGLAALVDGFKRKLAEEKRAAERAAWEAAEKARRDADAKAAAANAADIEAQREAQAAKEAAMQAEKAAQDARKDAKSVKGLYTVTRYEITDHRDLLNWIARNRRDDLTAFIEEWARRNHKPDPQAAGLRVWTEKVAK